MVKDRGMKQIIEDGSQEYTLKQKKKELGGLMKGGITEKSKHNQVGLVDSEGNY